MSLFPLRTLRVKTPTVFSVRQRYINKRLAKPIPDLSAAFRCFYEGRCQISLVIVQHKSENVPVGLRFMYFFLAC